MRTTVLQQNNETKIVLCELQKTRYIHIYRYDNDGFVDNSMYIFDPETVAALERAFTPDYSEYYEPTRFFKD